MIMTISHYWTIIQSSICSMLKIIDAICSISCTYVSTVIVNPENENHPLEDLTMLECGSEKKKKIKKKKKKNVLNSY